MYTNNTNNVVPSTNNKLIYPNLSYALISICFEAHNKLGHYSREKQYGNFIEKN